MEKYTDEKFEIFGRFVIFDIDGTLSDSSHRVQYAQAKEWDTFHSLAKDDPVFVKIMDLAFAISDLSNIILLTGRTNKHRQTTLEWLQQCNVDGNIDSIIMRDDNDFRPDTEYKIDAIEQFFGDKKTAIEKIWFVVDDRDKVVEALRNYGLTVLQPAAGSY